MNKQKIFDTIITHLWKQGERSLQKKGGDCAYRGKHGSMCAVGILISDDEYDPIWDLNVLAVDELIDEYPNTNFSKTYKKHVDFLRHLQMAHDSDWTWLARNHFKGRFSDVAIKYKLNTKILDSLADEDYGSRSF